ncbi:hypothetical protein BJH93_14195 [Kocuria polaris]|nr:hypothetical protein [Kocuria polaris]
MMQSAIGLYAIALLYLAVGFYVSVALLLRRPEDLRTSRRFRMTTVLSAWVFEWFGGHTAAQRLGIPS